MKVLVANLGSTSFKYRLFDMRDETQLARGGVESIGAAQSVCRTTVGQNTWQEVTAVPDHAVAVRQCLDQLTSADRGCLASAAEVTAIGFKAVHAGHISGVQRIDTRILAAMEQLNEVAPAHNPPYIKAMRLLADRLPEIPLVAAFETGFHATIPERSRHYAIPLAWSEQLPIRRWGFHGASHRYIAARAAELIQPVPQRIISCHLGGSSSLCAIRHGLSQATSMGMSPQSGLPQNNRVGDFDPYAIPLIMAHTGLTLAQVLHELANEGGLKGLSGVSSDLREIEMAAQQGNERARLAFDVYVTDVRRQLGAMLVELGGTDAIVFTGGIGENSATIRQAVCRDLHELGIILDPNRNQSASGETHVHDRTSRAQIWLIPTNEELIVARQVRDLLQPADAGNITSRTATH